MAIDKSERTEVTVIERAVVREVGTEACVVVIHGEALGRRFPLEYPAGRTSGEAIHMVVGRSGNSDLMLDIESVSRRHAEFIVQADGRVSVRDLESTNGTYVNDRPVLGAHELRNGDLVKIGRSILKYLESDNIEAQYHEEIYRLTTTDGLTGAFNKRFFSETLEREIGRCFRYNRPLSLMMLDIDFFKKVNDTHGHLAGDAVLKQIAHVIAQNVRKEDVFARYGGEEFALILPEIEQEGAGVLAEKLRGLVQATRLRHDGIEIAVTMSFGVAGLPKDKEIDVPAFVQIADECLFKAKHGGRNRVVVAAPR